ncbi:MAG: energy-coupling factor transporter transmembrane component T family protein, partial [Christensenellales bacterium]
WRYDLTQEQLFYMRNISLKYFVSLPIAILFISATNPSEFAASLSSIGVSYRVSYSVALALRYIPDIQRDYHAISQAQQARGIELGKKEKLLMRLKNSVNILLPLILSSLQRIDVISSAMELRGFGKDKKKRTWYMKRPMKRNDFIAIALGALLLAFSLGMIAANGGRFWNPFAQ